MTINIIIGSTNPVKIKATEKAFMKLFLKEKINVRSVNSLSKVSDIPLSDEEMIQGAKNRAMYCFNECSKANFTVGIEGGLHINKSLSIGYSNGFLRAWVAVYSVEFKKISLASTITINLPLIILNEVLKGNDLKVVIDKLQNRRGVNKEEGAFGILTKGHITREDTFIQAIYAAVAPFYNEIYDL